MRIEIKEKKYRKNYNESKHAKDSRWKLVAHLMDIHIVFFTLKHCFVRTYEL